MANMNAPRVSFGKSQLVSVDFRMSREKGVNLRLARMMRPKDNLSGVIPLREELWPQDKLGNAFAQRLHEVGVLKGDKLDIFKLDEFLGDNENRRSIRDEYGFKMREGEEFNEQNIKKAVIGRLANPEAEVFTSIYGDLHQKVAEAIEALLSVNTHKWNRFYQFLRRQSCYPLIDLSGANLSGANLRGVDFNKINLRGAVLKGTNLSGADIRGADLRGAYLGEANLRGADFREANLMSEKLRLKKANLWRANLSGADLRRTDLRGAVLRGTNLNGADLRGVDLGKADTGGANLEAADLRSEENG